MIEILLTEFVFWALVVLVRIAIDLRKIREALQGNQTASGLGSSPPA